MVNAQLERRRSYLYCFGFSANDLQEVEQAAEQLGFAIIHCNKLQELEESLQVVQHCLGIFVENNQNTATNTAIMDLALKNSVAIKFFNQCDHIPSSLRVEAITRPADYLNTFLRDLVPQKFQELCLYSVSKVFDNLIPDYKTNWTVSVASPASDKMDFLIFCESVFDNFVCAVTVRSGLNYVMSRSPALSAMSEQDIMEYFSEVSNQVLGIINNNLKKININSRIGLPIVVQGNSIAEFRRRSSYFLPVLRLSDDSGELNISFQFLVPFLKGAPFSRNLDFVVGAVSEDKKLIIL